jgi:hypothetical protein
MKNKFVLFLSIVSTLFVLPSCEDVIEVDVFSDKDQLSIDAVITGKDTIQQVRLLRSISYFDNSGQFPPVFADSVYMTSNNGDSYLFELDPTTPGQYNYDPSSGTAFEVGKTYTMHIVIGNERYEATSTMNRAAPIDSVSYAFLGTNPPGDPDSAYVFLNAKDLPGKKDFYWIRTFRNNELKLGPGLINPVIDASGPGASSDGLPFIFPVAFLNVNDLGRPFVENDIIRIEILGIDEPFFWFLNELGTQLANGGLFATPPVNSRTNFISKGSSKSEVLGFFNVCAIEQYEVKLTK